MTDPHQIAKAIADAGLKKCKECEGLGYIESCNYYRSGCIDCDGSGYVRAIIERDSNGK